MPRPDDALALGLDFGTESVRALLVTLNGVEAGSAVARYASGQITRRLPTSDEELPPDFALQDPRDWLDASGEAVRAALKQARAGADRVISIGVDFTSCTMLPALRDGTPLCQIDRFRKQKYAWPKLWKHHAAKAQTDRVNAVARQRKEPWLDRYGGIIGLEWFFPKILETLDHAPAVYDATEVWLEAGDWYVWQLVGCGNGLPRSTCQAGYKAQWNAHTGYPSPAFFKALHPKMENVVRDKMPGTLMAPGERAGELCDMMAKKLGLRAGVPVSAAVIDAHAGVPGAGVAEPSTLVMVMGTSSCHMLNSRIEKLVPGVAGVAEGGILPGYFGYETGQAAVGDAFDWFRRFAGEKDFAALNDEAAKLPPGADGVLCMDWFNGCRTPLMDGSLTGAFTGLSINHGPAHMYRALLEASAFGLRWIVEVLREGGVPVRRFTATGGLPHHNPLLVQIYADVLDERVAVHPSRQGPALGAAILGVLAAGKSVTGFVSASGAIHAMARTGEPRLVRPDRKAAKIYDGVYARYRALAENLRRDGH
ncbi:MAG: ribulokinase [Planctomycetes bacterium]|nr:ribulokinase [Planctomycetota bacterium]